MTVTAASRDGAGFYTENEEDLRILRIAVRLLREHYLAEQRRCSELGVTNQLIAARLEWIGGDPGVPEPRERPGLLTRLGRDPHAPPERPRERDDPRQIAMFREAAEREAAYRAAHAAGGDGTPAHE